MIEDITIEYIKQLKGIESCCFETDREEQWFDLGVQCGLEVANPKSQWISVDDDLPCNHEEFIETDGHYLKETIYVITVNKYGIIENNYMILYDDGKWEWKYGATPCYWMLIPKLPKEIEIELATK